MKGRIVPQYLTTEEVAELFRVPVHTVHYWRTCKTGPRGVRIGKRVLYSVHDIDEWFRRRADDQQ
jgi:DNA-binding transcriptional MerR regulator